LETKHHATVLGSIVAYTGRFVDRWHAGLACSAGHSRAASGVLAYRSPVLSTLGISTPRAFASAIWWSCSWGREKGSSLN